MRKAVLVARILLGLMFLLFGLNGLLHFLPMPPVPGDAGLYLTLLTTHGISTFISVLQLIAAILLLVGRYVPLALVILGPILVNILLFHFLIAHGGAALGLIGTLLFLLLVWAYRAVFFPLLAPAPPID